MRLGSQLALPNNRETLLHFFERVQKGFPNLTRFRKTESQEYNLEEDRSGAGYRWISLEPRRITAGHVNPPSIEEALRLVDAFQFAAKSGEVCPANWQAGKDTINPKEASKYFEKVK
jgi:hypothetical protein